MSILQWFMKKKTELFEWKKWSILHTFKSVNFTLFTIRVLVGLVKKFSRHSSLEKPITLE